MRKRIRAVEDVSSALFSEWRSEIKQYSSDTMRQASQRKYDLAKETYAKLITAMKNAEARLLIFRQVMSPLLNSFALLRGSLRNFASLLLLGHESFLV